MSNRLEPFSRPWSNLHSPTWSNLKSLTFIWAECPIQLVNSTGPVWNSRPQLPITDAEKVFWFMIPILHWIKIWGIWWSEYVYWYMRCPLFIERNLFQLCECSESVPTHALLLSSLNHPNIFHQTRKESESLAFEKDLLVKLVSEQNLKTDDEASSGLCRTPLRYI